MPEPTMSFFGAVLKMAGRKVVECLFKSSLIDFLRAEVKDWTRKLPDDKEIEPAALFEQLPDDIDSKSRPAMAKLAKMFRSNYTPTSHVWLSALMEQWQEVRGKVSHPQPFFQLDLKDAKRELEKLAERLAFRCNQDKELFQNTVIEEIRGLKLDRHTVPEQRVADATITYLEARGLFYAALSHEHPAECFDSAGKVRDALTEFIVWVPRSTRIYDQVNGIRTACSDFRSDLRRMRIYKVRDNSKLSRKQYAAFGTKIDSLRKRAGSFIESICRDYSIAAPRSLSNLFSIPPMTERRNKGGGLMGQ